MNVFVPNIWDHMVTQSLYEPEIFFPMKDKYASEEETKAALEYCRNFVDKICSGTNLKLLHYLAFNELLVFLSNPSDAMDAESVAKNITPYLKMVEPPSFYKDKELFVCEPPVTDPLMSLIEKKALQNRCLEMVKPRDLISKTIEGKAVDPSCGKPYSEMLSFMKTIDYSFIVEQEKIDLILDLAVLSWAAFDAFSDSLRRASFLLNDNSAIFYKTLTSIVAKEDDSSFENALVGLLSVLTCKRDATGIKNLILLSHKLIKPEEMKVFANLTLELAEAVKMSNYPKGLL